MPDEEECALVHTGVLIDLRHNLRKVIELTVPFWVALVAYMARVLASRISKALITLVIDDLIAASVFVVVWTNFLQLAAQILQHSIVVDLVEVRDRVEVLGALAAVGAQVCVAFKIRDSFVCFRQGLWIE